MVSGSEAVLDLRSDTVTQPSAAMRTAMMTAIVGDDVLDGDPTTRALEEDVATRLGKESALFFPSGTMANQAAIWVLSEPGTEIFVDADSHIVHWELAGAAALAGVQPRMVRGTAPVMTALDLERAVRPPSYDAPDVSLVCVENTHNGAGGMITPLHELRAMYAIAQSLRVPLHMDGARLWNAHVASGVSLAELASCADTVMVSFSKGLGAPVGAALVGTRDVMTRARRARKRFGGGMRQSGMLAAAAMHGLQHHLSELSHDHANARTLAAALDGVEGARVVPPDTNIVMLDLPIACADTIVAEAKAHGIRVSAWSPTRIRAVAHRDASAARITSAAPILADVVARVIRGARS